MVQITRLAVAVAVLVRLVATLLLVRAEVVVPVYLIP
jgi:hypothetical protein